MPTAVDLLQETKKWPQAYPILRMPGWTASSAHLFTAVDHTVRLTLGLFADTRLVVESRDKTMRELLEAFDHLEEEFQNVEVKVSQAFSQRADSVTSMSRPD